MKTFCLMAVCVVGLGLAGVVLGADKSGPETDAAVVNVTVTAASELLEDKKVVVLDLRTPAEFKGGHLAQAKNIDFQGADFQKKLGELDRDATYLIYCRSGRRSGNSLATFKKLGFKSIRHLDRGYLAWVEAGKPVEK